MKNAETPDNSNVKNSRMINKLAVMPPKRGLRVSCGLRIFQETSSVFSCGV
jgi:hypothetical protein